MAATGLSGDPNEYRARLAEQSDEQIDIWVAELMRDVAKRRGIVRVVTDFQQAVGVDDRGFEQVFASGGGAPAIVGRDREGRLMVPTVTLHHLVPGVRSKDEAGRERLIDYLVANFDELVYV